MVPLIMCGPGIPQNRSIGALTSHLDLFPTLAELTGCPIPDVDGKSLHPILRGETAKVRDVIFAEYHPRLWPEVYNHTIITDKHRLTIYPLREQWGEFFDRNQDTYEHHNLFGSAAQKELITRLAARMTCDFKPQPDAGDEVLGNY
jgi:arylsulfatase A-like enzyme